MPQSTDSSSVGAHIAGVTSAGLAGKKRRLSREVCAMRCEIALENANDYGATEVKDWLRMRALFRVN